MAGLHGKSLKGAKANRKGRLRGYGNAIVAEVAAEFIGTVLDTLAHFALAVEIVDR